MEVYLIFITTLGSVYHSHLQSIDEETEADGNEVTSPESHGYEVAKPRRESEWTGSRTHALGQCFRVRLRRLIVQPYVAPEP